MPLDSLLQKVSVVLVDVKTPANIGSVARCMMNMGLSRLVLVRPPRDPREEALKLAASAREILDRAVITTLLDDAVADEGLVIGATRHKGRLRKNIRTPRETAGRVLQVLERNRVSIVFGNEVNGLDRDDLARCHEFVSIPSSDAFPSLNLSHAVMVVAYELFIASRTTAPVDVELALKHDLENFFMHLEQTLKTIGFLDHDHAARMMFTLRQIFGRAQLGPRDLQILRGILRTMDRIAKSKDDRV